MNKKYATKFTQAMAEVETRDKSVVLEAFLKGISRNEERFYDYVS